MRVAFLALGAITLFGLSIMCMSIDDLRSAVYGVGAWLLLASAWILEAVKERQQ